MNPAFLDFPTELDVVKRFMLESVDSKSDLIREVAGFMDFAGGKLLRPMILILIGQSLDSLDDRFLRVAASIELIHTATLLHDDVIDKASFRRGKPSVNAAYGDEVAILMADLLFSKAFDLALSVLDPAVLRLLCKVTRIMCEGEMFQIEKRKAILTEADYLRIIEAKTAVLFSATAAFGGILGNLPAESQTALEQFGLKLGMAFQIIDDILDYTASDQQMGKSVGNDLERGQQTLPLVRAFELATPADREELLHQLSNGRQMTKVLPVIEKYGGIQYATARAQSYTQEAQTLIASLNLNSHTETFHRLCDFVIQRSR